MIVLAAALLLQSVSQVEIATAATDVVVIGADAAASVTAESANGAQRPVLSVTQGVARVRDANESVRRVTGSYRITVPRSAHVVLRIRCVLEPDMPCPNAKVRIEGVASVAYQGFDGTAVISNVRGDVTAESLHGTVDVRSVGGGVSASSQTNAIRVTDVRGPSTIRSVTGMIYLQSLLGGASVTNTTGEIRLSGQVGSSARYELTTDIGQIRIALAEGSNATIEVNAPSDAVRVFTPGARVSRGGSRRRTVTIGSGSARISARTLNGGVDIGQRHRAN